MNPLIQCKTIILPLLIAGVLTCFAISPMAQAVVPAPDGGYPGGNTAEGQNALFSLTTGGFNTAVGYLSLRSDSTNSFNTAIGAGTLLANDASSNTATGAGALLSNTAGSGNTANGAFALFSNTIGIYNTASGFQALNENIDGGRNTAVGDQALQHHQTGDYNDAVGARALLSHTSGSGNNAVGDSALNVLSSGNDNTAIGDSAGGNLITGDGNIYIGVGIGGLNTESNHTYIRNINVTSVSGGGTDTVTVNLSTGLLGHLSSSRRYKEGIKPMDNSSEGLYHLKPVVFRYKKEIDQMQSPAFGLIAEQVAEVNPALVARNSQGQPESVHYEMVNAMLLNEFLKEHCKVQELEATVAKQEASIADLKRTVANQEGTIAQQQNGIEALAAHLREQDLKIQRVTAQFELGKPELRAVLNHQ